MEIAASRGAPTAVRVERHDVICPVLAFLGTACSKPEGAASSDSPSAVATATASDARNVSQAIDAAMARYIDAVTRRDTAAIAASLADDPVIVFPSGRH